MFEQKYEKYQNFLSENFHFLVVRFSIVFIMQTEMGFKVLITTVANDSDFFMINFFFFIYFLIVYFSRAIRLAFQVKSSARKIRLGISCESCARQKIKKYRPSSATILLGSLFLCFISLRLESKIWTVWYRISLVLCSKMKYKNKK